MNRYLKLSFLALLVILFFNNQDAQAYINPGSGSYIFQTIIGGVLSIFYFIKKIFAAIFKNNNKD